MPERPRTSGARPDRPDGALWVHDFGRRRGSQRTDRIARWCAPAMVHGGITPRLFWPGLAGCRPTALDNRAANSARWLNDTKGSVSAVADILNVADRRIPLKNPVSSEQRSAHSISLGKQSSAFVPHVAKIGAGRGISFASFLRFWAVAANKNSSLAPFGPRRRNLTPSRLVADGGLRLGRDGRLASTSAGSSRT